MSMKEESKELTKAEEQVMHVLWTLEKAFVKEVIAEMPEPKPAYNTVSTIIRILEKKGFIGHTAFGKTYQYHPLVSKDDYSNQAMNKMVSNYFGGSFEKMVSFFVKKNDVDVKDLDAMMNMIKQENKDQS